ncbi:polyprenyl synthetase family protein [Limosilactobacillus fastidiosus]|uniref:Polyprenyl synthetase family protein n=1 Tax=Limosilactobacillus fastidiosus TaxID=2759855 RepID=A0A7W3U0E3_9LACO|nr:polyprenyl synthetase family protein [Limosilactobacillus fastidiosus]MBB1063784.1 polyprenyl synthetase family protein [Limosilactobacillus fastidiosus]MBB1086345.1 polyprenyl synthetase family protein [Limosilactobacillus fastidiosus]MCD7084359.1 polyprenyl synthetase family protein [Limosilactobacillus fastidiosus]MCD7086280.1 polyprenyl synthetase family protein [Limosilactobacillus fastidiosus]MCD7115043.1 polyprenyl synthetase family protein [Limosilactobacillus fastidiosus]
MDNHYFQSDPQLNSALEKVNQLINQRIKVNNQNLQTALKKMASKGGKYLRPAFCLTFAQFGNNNWKSPQLIKIASSLEILHMATLIHDDVIDDSPERRGEESIQTAFGKDTAVYSGDLLFTVFFDLLVETMENSPYLSINAQAMQKILAGELGQMDQRYRQQTFLEYYRNINGKTATLFSLAAQEGAYFGGADSRTVHLAKHIGQNIGIAFQILDDILDYKIDGGLNKPILEDLSTGVYSLPLLLVLKDYQEELMPYLAKKRTMTYKDTLKVQELVNRYGGVTQAHQLAGKFTNKALQLIDELPINGTQKLLKRVTGQLLDRSI